MKTEKKRMSLSDLIPSERNTRKHSEKQIREYTRSVKQFGQLRPIVIDENNRILAGNGLYEAMTAAGKKEADVLVKSGMTEKEKNKLMLADNRIFELGETDAGMFRAILEDIGDFDIPGYSQAELEALANFDFGEPEELQEAEHAEWFDREEKDYDSTDGEDEEYAEFVDKFKPKKTTDDCYTPENIYQTIADWVAHEYHVDKRTFVRPFYPGGDYTAEEYPDTCVVVDNPPFSILSEIIKFYCQRGVRFFLFAPSLTLFSARNEQVTYVAAHMDITYENGANVKTGFITNMDTCVVRSAPDLYKAAQQANDENLRAMHKELPKYSYPDNVLTAAMAGRYSQYGIEYRLDRKDCVRISELDSQKQEGKAIFGGGFLLSTSAAAERAAAERAAATRWTISPREQKIIDSLGR